MMRSQRNSSSGISSNSASTPPTLPTRAMNSAQSLWRCCCAWPRSLARSLCARGPRSFLLLSLWSLLLLAILLALTLPPRLRATRYSALDATTDAANSARLLRAHERRIGQARRSLSLLLTRAHLQQQDADAADPGSLSHADVWGDEEWQHHAPPEYSPPASIAEGVLRNWAHVEGVTEPWPEESTDATTPAAIAMNSGVDAVAVSAATAAAAGGVVVGSAASSSSSSPSRRARVLAGARLGYPPNWTPHTSLREQQLANYTGDLCVVVATVPRPQAYFMQTVASLLHALSPQMQQRTHIYVYNGAEPHTSHADVMWLEAELERARELSAPSPSPSPSSPSAPLWPRLSVLHGSERRARRAEELRRLFPAGSAPRARVEAHAFHSFSPSAAAGWHHRETMDYAEALAVCAQHQALRGRGLRGAELRAAMRGVDGDPLLELAADPAAAAQRAAAAWPAAATVPVPPRRSPVQPAPPPLALVLEDDVVLSHDFLRRLYRALRPLWDPRPDAPAPAALDDSLPRGLRHAPWGGPGPARPPPGLRARRGAAPPWAFVRVFLTDYWDGWEAQDGARVIAPAAALFGAAASLAFVAADWLRRAARRWMRERRRVAAAWAAAAAGSEKGVELALLRTADRDRDPHSDRHRDVEDPRRHGSGDVENGHGGDTSAAFAAALSLPSRDVPSLPSARSRSGTRSRSHSSASSSSASPSLSPPSPSLLAVRDLEAQLQASPRAPRAVSSLSAAADPFGADAFDSFGARPFPSFLSLLRATPFLFPPPPAAVDTDAPSADSSAPPPPAPAPSAWLWLRGCSSGRGPALLLSALLWAALGAALLLAAGKQNLGALPVGGGALPLLLGARAHSAGLRVLDAEAGAAGTLGVVYPGAALPPLLHYISERLAAPRSAAEFRHLGVDDVVNRWAREAELPQLHAAPDLVQHVGAFSSAAAKNQGNFQAMKTSPSFVP